MKYFLLFLVCVLPLSAKEILLDDVMSKEEQRNTGVYKLSLQEKIALEDWLNQTFVLKTSDQSSQGKALSLSINIDNGKKIQLSDNSIWEIAPSDVSRASVWITPFPVKLSPSNDPAYPYLITNTTSGESVKAKKWVKPASSPQPQSQK